jgi:integrase
MAWLIKRGPVYYIRYSQGKRSSKRKISTNTGNFQLAKEKLREFESAWARGDSSLPTRTAIADVLTNYVAHIRTTKTDKSAQTETYYLREAFGPVCDAVRVTSRKLSPKARKLRPKPGQDKRRRAPVIEAECFERITTAQVATFISGMKESRGLSPTTANHYRQILTRLFNWAKKQGGVKMPGDANPAAAVERYKMEAPEIRFLTLEQIDEQLIALDENVQLQAMVATLIFAGLRREELVWLTPDDLDLASGVYGLIRIHRKTVDEETWQPKTRKNRVVPINSRLSLYLDKWRLKRGKNPWLFPSPKGQRWEPDNFSADLRAANVIKEMGWKNKRGKLVLPFGSLHYRHTFGSQLAMKGESLYKIAKLMGNSPQIAERHYAALVAEDLTDTVEFRTPRQPGVNQAVPASVSA